MALALSAGDWIEELVYPDPADVPDADAWVDAFFAFESARGPQHGREPAVRYATLWALWLSAVPYGLWSERIARPSMDEHAQWVARLEDVLGRAIDHFGLALREGVTLADLAGGGREPDRGRVAEPVPDGAGRRVPAPLRPPALERRDYGAVCAAAAGRRARFEARA